MLNIKHLLVIILSVLCLSAEAAELKNIKYKNIKDGKKITCIDGVWTQKVNRKKDFYLQKNIIINDLSFSNYYASDCSCTHSSGTHYEFIKDGKFYGYSNVDLKFYELCFHNGLFERRELSEEEIQYLFPKHKIVRISDFSQGTNSLKIKKRKRNMKIIVLNDTCSNFIDYEFNTNNAKIELYPLAGFINVKKKGMIHFSPMQDDYKDLNWYVLLIR